jgi:hypothetical protein
MAQSEGYGESVEDHTHCRVLLVHLTALSTYLKQAGLMNQLSVNTMWRMAQVYCCGGKLVDAEALLHQAISLLQNLKPQSNIFIFWLGSILWDLGKFREAEAIEHEVLEW